ncbi:hypothetical protein OROMI_015816 [Orobanche minor]
MKSPPVDWETMFKTPPQELIDTVLKPVGGAGVVDSPLTGDGLNSPAEHVEYN